MTDLTLRVKFEEAEPSLSHIIGLLYFLERLHHWELAFKYSNVGALFAISLPINYELQDWIDGKKQLRLKKIEFGGVFQATVTSDEELEIIRTHIDNILQEGKKRRKEKAPTSKKEEEQQIRNVAEKITVNAYGMMIDKLPISEYAKNLLLDDVTQIVITFLRVIGKAVESYPDETWVK
jgi:hypothetical protein